MTQCAYLICINAMSWNVFNTSSVLRFLTDLKEWTKISSPETVKVFGCCLCLNSGNILSNCLVFCTRKVFFWSSVNISGIHQAEIFRTFKIRHHFQLFSDFWDICLVCYSHRSARFSVFLLCASHIFFLSTNKLSQMIIYQTRKLSPIQLKPAVAKWPSFVQLFIY